MANYSNESILLSSVELRADMTTVSDYTLSTEKILSFYIQKDRFSIADILSFTFSGNTNSSIKAVDFYINDELVFSGIVDSKKSIFDSKGRYTTVVSRSIPALLLDNEILPKVYTNLTVSNLMSTFAQPFGITGHALSSSGVASLIVAEKGVSYWEFIEKYCIQVFGERPYMNSENKIVLDVITEDSYYFSNEGDGIPFSSIAICDERYNMISTLNVKTQESADSIHYGYVVNNLVAQDIGVERERYYNCSEDDYQTYSSLLMRENQLDAFEVEIETESLILMNVGDSASVYQDSVEHDGLYVSQVKISGDSTGLSTTIKLWDKIAIE